MEEEKVHDISDLGTFIRNKDPPPNSTFIIQYIEYILFKILVVQSQKILKKMWEIQGHNKENKTRKLVQ